MLNEELTRSHFSLKMRSITFYFSDIEACQGLHLFPQCDMMRSSDTLYASLFVSLFVTLDKLELNLITMQYNAVLITLRIRHSQTKCIMATFVCLCVCLCVYVCPVPYSDTTAWTRM